MGPILWLGDKYLVTLSALIVYFGLSITWDGSLDKSAQELIKSLVVTGSITVILLLGIALALGLYLNKYPKVSFFTGLEWTTLIPLALGSSSREDYTISFFIHIFLICIIAIIIWRYADYPYSKCRKALNFFDKFSIPFNFLLLSFFYAFYVVKTPKPVQAFFLATTGFFMYSTKLAFEKVKEAKIQFDKDIKRIERGGMNIYSI
ncbi:hypothetical protein PFDSM3638_07620 [Pyrococcus furiosus DSM 3638]|uniref:Uncharacterized protein n=2 Tax=Pyrococcus furiosus (strain ATCC 43587 / DSM 3638 / JCM 8422 / Vc1) TaxID=186497 RepID=Q8U0S0_PYRFU|nr:hypothetical protein [Pyrococcus furiosus]AAL81638.1 hypothetical protein PF1514 [Pyrococcus furiosus DSM 3638]QEK79139.1 hypothetical protein PFDSM3638_07620 [Pyrococcus furiosus DSM 3638]